MKGPERRPRPAHRAVPLTGTPPETHLAPGLLALCHSGERAVSVFLRPDGDAYAALGSPMDPEAYAVFRTDGVYVFLRGDVPATLDLRLEAGGTVAVRAGY
ncbi:MAG: hypothetical protein ACRDZ3_21100 [Acidimicrobiia bacterium]